MYIYMVYNGVLRWYICTTHADTLVAFNPLPDLLFWFNQKSVVREPARAL